jgi:hypothetical protein
MMQQRFRVQPMFRTFTAFKLIAILVTGCGVGAESNAQRATLHYKPAPTFYADQPACRVKSIRKLPTVYEGLAKSPVADVYALSEPDANGVYQIVMMQGGIKRCITCARHPAGPRVEANKMMVTWHPSGKWLVMGVEEDKHDMM